MLDTCDTCEEQDTPSMWINGNTLCYECAELTQGDTPEELEDLEL